MVILANEIAFKPDIIVGEGLSATPTGFRVERIVLRIRCRFNLKQVSDAVGRLMKRNLCYNRAGDPVPGGLRMTMEALMENLRYPKDDFEADLPTMDDLPSEYPEDSQLPDVVHPAQSNLLKELAPGPTIERPDRLADRIGAQPTPTKTSPIGTSGPTGSLPWEPHLFSTS